MPLALSCCACASHDLLAGQGSSIRSSFTRELISILSFGFVRFIIGRRSSPTFVFMALFDLTIDGTGGVWYFGFFLLLLLLYFSRCFFLVGLPRPRTTPLRSSFPRSPIPLGEVPPRTDLFYCAIDGSWNLNMAAASVPSSGIYRPDGSVVSFLPCCF